MDSFQVIQPSALLAPYVKQYWFLETDDVTQTQRIIPQGSINIIFHREKRIFSLTGNVLQPKAFVGGQTIGYSDIIQTGKVNMISITFQPYGAKAFLAMPMNELNNKIISLDSLGEPWLKELDDRLQNNFDNEACARIIESFLLKRLYSSKAYNHKRMLAVVQFINAGQADIAALAQISCLSYKQFKRIFAEYIGTNPKDFLRVVRFQKALFLLHQHPEMNFAQLAFECGYYDQPHLIKEFKTFSGYTPVEYIAICVPYSDYFS